ncbi:NLR family CARD domain-containing protein 3-like [Ixodes scapularis]|uniref:NLR family CARD domain-containing protein 3-like n=1 Tax=Ixodes scapularis TaxID=6945 RepID=UPI001C38F06A|nr:NLR family CARD domain-containing protein 3-like [Ixodes scapularis]
MLRTFVNCNPSASEYRVVSVFLMKRLLNNHHCVQEVELSYAGELFDDESQPQVHPTAGIRQIALNEHQMNKPQLCQLVRVMLRGDPVQMKLRHVCFGATEMTALRGHDCLALVKAIETSNTIRCLKLDSNMVGVRGAQRFAQLLRTNKTLLSVSLFKTKINDKGAVAIGQALAGNSTLEFLKMGGNSIGPTGAQAIASSLELNTSLTYLDLQRNDLDNSGAVFLARMLQSNKTLRTLDISRSFVRSDGAVAIADSLMNNRTLLELSIDGNTFTDEAVVALARLVASNKTLKHFHASTSFLLESPAPFNEFVEALALNRWLEGIKLSTWRSLMSLANLRVTKTIRSVTVSDKVRNMSLMWLVRGLAFNSSIWKFRIGSYKLGVSLCRTIATMLVENSTLSALILNDAPVDELGLVTLAGGLSSNQVLQKLSVVYPASSVAGFSVSQCLRRNCALLNRALQFVLKIAKDKSSAAAFQVYRRSEYFTYELSLLRTSESALSADSLVREANKYIEENYFVITGVVKDELVCLRPHRRTALTTKLDQLNAYCLYVITSFLKVSDVKD